MRLACLLLLGSASAAAFAPEVIHNVPTSVKTITNSDLERLPTARSIQSVISDLNCTGNTIPTITPVAPAAGMLPAPGSGLSTISCVQPADLRMVQIYRLHNLTRAEAGSPPMLWDSGLAAGAAPGAQFMADTGTFVHTSREGRRFIRENIAQTPVGWTPVRIFDRWRAERRLYVPGIFPNVSANGDWSAVAHYSQIIWDTTWRLGCAIRSGRGFDWTICRYSPPGNRDGQPAVRRPLLAPPLPPPPPPP